MANDRINYSQKINEMLDKMPDFVTDFIYNFGHSSQMATMLQYSRDIYDFLRFMVNDLPSFFGKEIREITLEDLSKIEPMDINRYLTLIKNSKDSRYTNKTERAPLYHHDTTIKRCRATLSSMFGFFVNNGKLKINPVLATKTIKIPEKELVYLTNDEQKLLLNTIRSGSGLEGKAVKYHERYCLRDSALFLLLLDTGLRVSEMLSTDIVDYDFDKCCVFVVRKGGGSDTVYFSDECAAYLLDYFDAQRTRYLLSDNQIPAFTTITGERLGVRAVEKLVKKYVGACLPAKAKSISPHKLRSSFAMSFYAASDNDLLLLKEKLHHKSISTTNIYAKASDTKKEASRNVLQGLR